MTDSRNALIESGINSVDVSELSSKLTKESMATLVGHAENCQWTLYELRRKLMGDSNGPIKDGKVMSKPVFDTAHVRNLEHDTEDSDARQNEGDNDSQVL